MNPAARIRPVAAETLLVVSAAAVVGYGIERKPAVAVAAVGAAVALWALTQSAPSAVALGASLPLVADVTGGRFGVQVAASDIVLALLLLGLLVQARGAELAAAVRSLRPVAVALVPYGAVLLVLAGAHPGRTAALNTLQRFELFLVPLLVGAALARRKSHMLVLQAYVLASTVLAVVWPVSSLGLQKNPAGQMIANALLLLVGAPQLRRLAWCALPLIAGLLLTQSRGAILAALVGAVVLLVLDGSRRLRLLFARVVPVLATALLVFQFLPAAARRHVTTLHASADTAAGYSLYVRGEYTRTAEQVIRAHPVVGVGVGRYREGIGTQTSTTDPHDVLLLDAAEGGLGLAAAFMLLVAGTTRRLWRLRRLPLAPAAAAVVTATVAHGLVDVYWVRGTPVLGWLLVGMVCGGLTAAQETPA